MSCEIVEASYVGNASGYPHGKEDVSECFDCGTHVCNEHADTCDRCNELFCLTCLGFHERSYAKKPVRSDDPPLGRTSKTQFPL
jgi:hypothetical protein